MTCVEKIMNNLRDWQAGAERLADTALRVEAAMEPFKESLYASVEVNAFYPRVRVAILITSMSQAADVLRALGAIGHRSKEMLNGRTFFDETWGPPTRNWLLTGEVRLEAQFGETGGSCRKIVDHYRQEPVYKIVCDQDGALE